MTYAERLADDADPLRDILRAARAWGVSPSRFLGRPAVTSYVYNDIGRVARTESVEWTTDDAEQAMALEEYEAGLCQGCRDRLAETTRPDRDGAYRAGLPIRCHRCTAQLQQAERYADTTQPTALLIPVELIGA